MLFRRTSSNAQSRRALVADTRHVESLEDRRLMSVTSLSLYNAVDDVSYGTLNEGASVSFVQLNTWGITIKADATSDVASVRWNLDGTIVSTESFAPFAIGGDLNSGRDLQPYKFTKGSHTLTVTAFTGTGGTGAVLNSFNVTFQILDQPL